MNITEIIKNAFTFPTRNLETLSIYAILSILSTAFLIQGIVTLIGGIFDIANLVIGIIYIAISIIIGFIMQRISVQCVKSGIDLEEKMPDFNWWQNIGTGVSKVIITIFYIFIPSLIVIFIALITNLIGSIMTLGEVIYLQAPNFILGSVAATEAVSQSTLPLLISIYITISAAMILYIIFSFFQVMGEARLAHTGSLKNALNIFGAARDITRIGVGKLVLLSVILFIIICIVEFLLTLVIDQLFVLSILYIVVTPYLVLFCQRSLGLLYSDIV